MNIRPRRYLAACLLPTALAIFATPVWAVNWVFNEDYNSLATGTGDLVSVSGLSNPDKATMLYNTAPPPVTYSGQWGPASGASTVITDLGGGNKVLELTRDGNQGTEAFTVMSTGQEPDAPRGGMAVSTVKFRIDSSTGSLGSGSGFHISFYRNLINDGTIDDGPWVNNIASIGFRNIGGGTFDLWADGYVSPFGTSPDSLLWESQITTLNLDTWYTAEIYLPAFNVETDPESVDAQYRILDETGTNLLAYGAQKSMHQTREILFTPYSTENTPEITGIQTINTQSMNANWMIDDLRIGKGTGADIDAIYANFSGSVGSYYDYDFDGDVDGDDASFYISSYLLTSVGDVDLDRDIDGDDLAIAQNNLGNAGGWSDGDTNADGVIDATDIAFIQGIVGVVGDLDGDGFVGIADLNIVLGNWNQNVTAGDPSVGDPSGDGFVGIEDLNTVLGNWNAGTPPTANAVPEPASLALFGFSAMVTLRRRRWSRLLAVVC